MNREAYWGLDYGNLAQGLSVITGKTIKPSQLEVLTQPSNEGTINISVADGALSGHASQYSGSYQTELILRLPRETLRVIADDPSFDRKFRENLRLTLAKLYYLAKNPSEGRKLEGGRELTHID